MVAPTTYVSVDLEAIRHNLGQVRSRLHEGCALCAVVKANAYGHGLIRVARACVEAGAEFLAVSTTEEGVRLRDAGLTAPILVFLPPTAEECDALVAQNLTATVVSTAQVMQLRRAAERQGRVAKAHIYEDLGLGRLGPEEPILEILETAEPWPEIEVSGIYAHCGPPGTGLKTEALNLVTGGGGLKVWAAMVRDGLKRVTERRLCLHVAASALILQDPGAHLDMVRPGTLLYGQYPDHVPASARTLDLRPCFELRSRIVAVHTLEKGDRVGYGGEFICRRRTRVATVPVGFAHGLGMVPESATGSLRHAAKVWLRARASRAGRPDALPQATVCGHPAPIIGRISMDQCCLDITDIPQAACGTEVVLPIRRVATNPAIPRLYRGEKPGQERA
jgi:alanine racemase